MNKNLINSIDAVVADRSRSKMVRIFRSPVKQLYYKLLDTLNLVVQCKAQLFFDVEINVFLPERVSSELYRYGYFEEGLTRSIINLLREGDCFIDIGTHVGYYTLLASKLVGEKGRVVSFEPTNRTRAALESNTKLLENVIIEDFAVWSMVDQLKFKDFGWINSAFNTLYSSKLEKPAKYEEYLVRTIDLDTYVLKSGICPNFIKIDAEGAEFEILKGAKNTIERLYPIFTIEVGDFESSTSPSSREAVKFLLDMGYAVYESQGGRLVEHTIMHKYGYDNLIFMHPKNNRITN